MAVINDYAIMCSKSDNIFY